VSLSLASIKSDRYVGWMAASSASKKRVPTHPAWAPSANTAARPRPSAIPPAATSDPSLGEARSRIVLHERARGQIRLRESTGAVDGLYLSRRLAVRRRLSPPPAHPDEHRPQRPVLLAVDQELAKERLSGFLNLGGR
jgi:hypothetical protein